MRTTEHEHDVTLWLADDVPTRMFYAGRRWRVSDTPTVLPGTDGVTASGWRFQATDPQHRSLVFDVYGTPEGWHVHRAYD